jgi:hypothetical protein
MAWWQAALEIDCVGDRAGTQVGVRNEFDVEQCGEQFLSNYFSAQSVFVVLNPKSRYSSP